MKMRRTWNSAILSIGLLLAAANPGLAVPAGFNEGVQAYGAHRYNQALASFSQAARAEPNNALVHYYMGLSYQGMNQMTLAKQQYEWVAGSRSNPTLASQASQALQNLSRYKSSYAGSSSNAPTAVASASPSPSARGAAAPAPKLSGRLKIYYFTTDWCKWCKKMEPTWDQVSSEMGSRAEFKKLDGDDPSNAPLKEKWGIMGYPSLIFTDNSQNVLGQHGYFENPDEFKSMIAQFTH